MITFSSLVIVDPFFFPGKPEDLAVLRRKLVDRAHERQDVWPSREEARESELKGSRRWDQRVRELYLRYGIRRHPYSKCSVTPYNGVTLACTREQEATMYRDVEGATKPIKYLDALCRKIPVHIAFGERADIIRCTGSAASSASTRRGDCQFNKA
ncbi:hypothetical protein PHLCEN_2v11524 [Hermanssonia centrifuga]|uniref:Uncharacterized protein n=1 Tax=Hermanssonia centrifuga TaxID=98765 RepID=A0A2R6NJP8_9APHY|nr:hypothetical protein PHLCEN_2v11524 [Hermanssonia centrifuga]